MRAYHIDNTKKNIRRKQLAVSCHPAHSLQGTTGHLRALLKIARADKPVEDSSISIPRYENQSLPTPTVTPKLDRPRRNKMEKTSRISRGGSQSPTNADTSNGHAHGMCSIRSINEHRRRYAFTGNKHASGDHHPPPLSHPLYFCPLQTPPPPPPSRRRRHRHRPPWRVLVPTLGPP